MSGSETPSWLTGADENPSSAPTTSSGPPIQTAFSATEPAEATIENEEVIPQPKKEKKKASLETTVDESDLPRMVLIMRLANMGVVTALVTVSIMQMVGLPGPTTWVLSLYATCGGLLVCCLETQLKFLRVGIAMNFGFLFSPFFRFFFYLLLASLAWSFDSIPTRIVSIAIVVVAFFNTYILFRYPSYRAVRERIAEEEDKKLEAKISAQMKKQAIKSLSRP